VSHRSFVRLLTVVAGASLIFVLGFVLRPAVHAQAGHTLQITVGQQGSVAANILVHVPVTLTCDPASAGSVNLFLSVEQAGNPELGHIARGSTNFGGTSGPLPAGFVCDNAPHSVVLAILADAAGAPFGSGSAVVSGGVNAGADSASIAPRVIALEKSSS
jgi:hypothetical protein